MLRLLQEYGIFELRITGKESHYILNSLYIIVLISSMLNASTARGWSSQIDRQANRLRVADVD